MRSVLSRYAYETKSSRKKAEQRIENIGQVIETKNRALARAVLDVFPEREALMNEHPGTISELVKSINRRLSFYRTMSGDVARRIWALACGIIIASSIFILSRIFTSSMRVPSILLGIIASGLGFATVQIAPVILKPFYSYIASKVYECEAEHLILRYLHPRHTCQDFSLKFRDIPMRNLLPVIFSEGPEYTAVRNEAISLARDLTDRKTVYVIEYEAIIAKFINVKRTSSNQAGKLKESSS